MIVWALWLVVAKLVLAAALAITVLSIRQWQARPVSGIITTPESTRGQTASIVALLLLAPLFLFPSPLAVVGIIAVLLLWLWNRRTSHTLFVRTPLDWPIAGMAAMVPIGMLASPNIEWSLGRAFFLVYCFVLYYGIVRWVNSPRRLQIATVVFLLAGTGMSFLALIGTDWQAKVPFLRDLTASLPQVAQGLSRDSTGFHPNIVAGALLWVILPLLALFANAIRERRNATETAFTAWYTRALFHPILLAGMLLITAGTLLLTQSRGALLSAAVGAGVLAWLWWPKLRPLVIGAGVVVAVLTVVLLADRSVTAGDPPIGSPLDNFGVRVNAWRSALHGIADYPLTGVGLDAFNELMPIRYPAPMIPDSYDIGHAHNQFLQAALDLGLPGLAAYLALWCVAAWMALRILRLPASPGKSSDGATGLNYKCVQALAAGIAAALAASFMHGMADVVVLVSKPGVLFWAMLALLAASARLIGRTDGGLTPNNADSTLQG